MLTGIGGFSVLAGLAGALFFVGRQRSTFQIAVGSDDDAWNRKAAIALMDERDDRDLTEQIAVVAVAESESAKSSNTDSSGVNTITTAGLSDSDLVVWAGEPPVDPDTEAEVIRWPTTERVASTADGEPAGSELRQRVATLFDRFEQ